MPILHIPCLLEGKEDVVNKYIKTTVLSQNHYESIAFQLKSSILKRRAYLRKWAAFEYLGMYFRGLRDFPKKNNAKILMPL